MQEATKGEVCKVERGRRACQGPRTGGPTWQQSISQRTTKQTKGTQTWALPNVSPATDGDPSRPIPP